MNWKDKFITHYAANGEYPDLTGFFPDMYRSIGYHKEDDIAGIQKSIEQLQSEIAELQNTKTFFGTALSDDLAQTYINVRHKEIAKMLEEIERKKADIAYQKEWSERQFQPSKMVDLLEYKKQVCEALEGKLLDEGDIFSRLVIEDYHGGVSKLDCHELDGSKVDVMDHHFGNVQLPVQLYGVHVTGDIEYWARRLSLDYDANAEEYAVVDIVAQQNDFLIEDFQYNTDPETGIKADSWILVTHRPQLFDGKDFTINEEATVDAKSVEVEDRS